MPRVTAKVVHLERRTVMVRKSPPTFVVRFIPGVINIGGGGGFNPETLPLTNEIKPQELIGKFSGQWCRQSWDNFSKNTIDCGLF
jgi:hypothetical protein